MKKTITLPFLSIFLLFSAGCSNEDYHLNKSIFIEDVTNPGLPVYSEWGYNTFGAYIDRVPFVSDMVSVPAKIIVNPDTFSLILNGKISPSNNQPQPVSLKFCIPGYAPSVFSDLISLNGKSFNLQSDNCLVELTENSTTSAPKIIAGELKFIRVQKLFVDKELTKTILSGTFYFQTFRGNDPITISSGRFDLGFGYENFYSLQ